jgi:hypothetical protein
MLPVIERIWYVKESVQPVSSTDSSQVTMRLFFTKRDPALYPVLQDEVEAAFNYFDMHLVHKINSGYSHDANNGDILDPSPGSYVLGTEMYGQYTYGISVAEGGLTNGLTQFGNAFSIINQGTLILPVSIINLSAYQQGTAVQVEWKNATEVNLDHYEVEKSPDGIQFLPIGTITAKNNGNEVIYNWIDPKPVTGNNFYRIKVIDKNDAFTYTNLVNVPLSNNKSAIAIYTNPIINNHFTLQIINLPKGRYSLIMYNINGQQVLNKIIEHQGGSSAQTIELLPYIKSGTYSIVFDNERIHYNNKVIVQQ